MNKKDLVQKIAETNELTKQQAADVLDTVLDSIGAAIAAGDKVQLLGFGTFEKRERPARTARNPRTGETIEIAAASVPVFKPDKSASSSAINNLPLP